MKNTLADLNNHLFAQLERLNDEDIAGEKLTEELKRSKAVTGVAHQVIGNAKLMLDATKFRADLEPDFAPQDMPKILQPSEIKGLGE
ncbi:hypothetical protein [Pseudoalteromonas piscicida]